MEPEVQSSPSSRGKGRTGPWGRRRRPPFFAILLLSSFLLLTLSFITFRQLRAGEANRLRLLAGFAEQVEATVPELVTRFVNTIAQSARGCVDGAAFEAIPNVEFVAGPFSPGEQAFPGVKLIPRGTRVAIEHQQLYETDVVEECRVEREARQESSARDNGGTTPRSSGPSLDISIGDSTAAAEGTALAATGDVPETTNRMVARYVGRLDLAAIVEPLVIPDVFDLVVIARRQGSEVLFQRGNRELKMDRVNAAWESRERGLWNALADKLEKEPESAPSGDGTRIIEVTLADAEYRVFLQPITLQLRDGSGNPVGTERWIACGLISWDRLLASSFTTSPVLLFLIVILFPLLLAAWPFLKLALISRHQRFTRFDVAALFFSCLVSVALVTYLILDFSFMTRFQSGLDRQLGDLADALVRNFHQEVDRIERQLVRLDQEDVGLDYDPPEPREKEGELRVRFGPRSADNKLERIVEILPRSWVEPGAPAAARQEGDEYWSSVHGPLVYPILHSIVWANAEGEQEIKIPFQRDSILRNDIGDRRYFRCASGAGDLGLVLRLVKTSSGDKRRLCLESIRSRTSADDLAAFALETGDSGHPVLVLVTRLASMSRAHLAPGFAFAVVDADGVVQFHSERSRNTSEDFFKATGSDRLLTAMIRERRSGRLSISYWGRRYRVFLEPLPGTPWSIVTLRNAGDLRARNFEVLFDFLGAFLPILLTSYLTLLLALRFLPVRYTRRLWPSRLYSPIYRAATFAAPFATATFSWLVRSSDPRWVVAGTFVPPLIVLLAMVLGSRHLERDAENKSFEVGRRRLLAGWRELRWWELPVILPLPIAASAALARPRDSLCFILFVATLVGVCAYVAYRRSFVDRTSTAPYVCAFTVILLCTAAVPTTALFRLAQARQLQLIVQDTQVGLVRSSIDERDHRITGPSPITRWLEGYDAYLEGEVGAARARTARAFFGSEVQAGDRASGLRTFFVPATWPYGSSPLARSQFPHPPGATVSRILGARIVPLTDLSQDASGTDLSRFARPEGRWGIVHRGPDTELVGLIPGRRGADETFIVSSDASPRGFFGDRGPFRGLLLGLSWIAMLSGACGISFFVARSVLIADLAPNHRHATLEKIVDRIGTFEAPQRVLLVFSLPEAVERVVSHPRRRDRFSILRFADLWEEDRTDEDRQRVIRSELARTGPPAGGRGSQVLVVTHFRPSYDDPDLARQQIELLDRLRFADGPHERSILLVVPRMSDLWSDDDEDQNRSADERSARSFWNGYLSRFTQRYGRDGGKPLLFRRFIKYLEFLVGRRDDPVWATLGKAVWRRDPTGHTLRESEPADWLGEDDLDEGSRRHVVFEVIGPAIPISMRTGRRLERLLDAIWDECRWTWRLQRIGIDLLAELEDEIVEWKAPESTRLHGARDARPEEERDEDFDDADVRIPLTSSLPTRNQLVSRIESAASPYYQRIWSACDSTEKLVLHQLASEGVVNPKAFDTVLDLLNKGLVVRTEDKPALRVLNTSFATFINRSVRRSHLAAWEEEEGFSAWEVWKWVLPLPLLLLGIFLFVTQQDAVSNIVGLMIAVTSLVPTGFNLYQHFQQLTTEREADVKR
jgi:hypothetical protein